MRKVNVLLVTACLFFAGCQFFQQTTERQKFAQVQDTFIVAVETAIDLRQQGKISQEEWDKIVLPLIEVGDSLLDLYDEYTKVGLDTKPIVTQLIGVLDRLHPFIVRALE